MELKIEHFMRRFLSLDLLRGIALMLMVIFHVFLNISDLSVKASADIGSLTPIELILIAFIGVFIHWQSFFLFISAIVHWYGMSKMHEAGVSPHRILVKQLLFGGALYIFGFLREPFLSPWGMTAQWFINGGFTTGAQIPWNYWVFIFRTETISNIGISIILTSLIFFGVTFLDKMVHQDRFRVILKTCILGAIACLFIFLAPTMRQWVNNVAGITLHVNENYIFGGYRNGFDYSIRWLLNTIAGQEFPLFPNYSYFVVGAIVGLAISQKQPTKRTLVTLLIGGIITTIIGVIYWLFIDQLIATMDITFHVHPTGFVLFSIGLEMLIMVLFLRINEFNPRLLDEKRMQRRLRFTRIFRRWGILSLTIFTFNIFELAVRGLLDLLIPVADFRHYGQLSLPWTFLTVFLLVFFWDMIIRLWELLKFKGSIEWIFLRLFKLGKIYNKADPLDIRGSLYEVTPILFVSRPTEETPVILVTKM